MAIPEKYSHISFVPPAGARREAARGLAMRREHGRGGTAVGIARARDLSNGTEVSPSTVRRMKAFFDRHAQDRKATGFRAGEEGFPSNGKIADLLWGGRSGESWANKVVRQMNAADERTSSLDMETATLEEEAVSQRSAGMQGVERRYFGSFEKAESNSLAVEHRADPETGKRQTYIVGYAAKFGTDSLLLGDFIERLEPSAFDIVKEGKDANGKPLATRCLFNHDPNHLLGRYPTTLKMFVDKIGLRYECLLPESRKDLEESIARGDLRGSSFSFVIDPDGGEKWITENGQSIRLVKKIKSLLDVSPVTYPAYDDATVAIAKRSYEVFAASARPQIVVPAFDASGEIEATKKFLDERRGFCATGPGGGIDNSCGKGEGGGGSISSAAKGAMVGAAVGAIGGIPGAIIGAAALGFAAYVASGKKTDEALESAKEEMGIDDNKLNVASASIFGKGKPQKLNTKVTEDGVIAVTGRQGQMFISGKPPVFGVKGKSNLHFDPNGGGKEVAKDAELAAKSVGVKTVTVQSWTPDTDAGLKAAGFRKAAGGFSKSEDHAVWIKDLSRQSKSRRSYEDLMKFFEERAFCATGKDGGIDNSCGKYMEVDSKNPESVAAAQKFIDKAREEQLSKGGKDGGQADEGGGVQTWSKGDHFPWTVKQVGTDEGHVQGQHPDGSKTEKYPFRGGDTSAAMKQVSDEIKRRKSSRADQVIAETLKFLKDRRA